MAQRSKDGTPPTNVAQVQFQPSAIVGFSLAPRVFSPGTPVFRPYLPPGGKELNYSSFPPSTNTNISKFPFNQDGGLT